MINSLIELIQQLGRRAGGDGPRARNGEESHTRTIHRLHEEHLPDELRIIRLIEEHDGVVWQCRITEEMGWSESTTSRRLAKLEQQNRLHRYRVGRRKAVYLPGAEPELLGERARQDGLIESAP